MLVLALAADVLVPVADIAGWAYGAAAVAALVVSIRSLWRARRGLARREYAPRLALNGAVLVLLALGAPAVAREWEFRANAGRRAAVVRQIEEAGLPPVPREGTRECGTDRALDGAARALAAGGTVVIGREGGVTSVFFVRDRFVLSRLGDRAGYLYRADGTPPTDGLFGCMFNVGILGGSTRRLADQWFWVYYRGID